MLSSAELTLKSKLANLKQNGFVLDDSSLINELIDDMLRNIGTFDSELRDDLIYESFYTIVYKGKIRNESLVEIAKTLIGKGYLTYDIESNNEYSVFRRSFSILFIDVILEWNTKANLLDQKLHRDIFEAICSNYEMETNHKGFYEEYGWAHTIAHTADVFCDLLASKTIGKMEVLQVLELIRTKFFKVHEYLVDGEDERTANVITVIIGKNPGYLEVVSEWVLSFASITLPGEMPERSQVKGNIRNLLRSIYFKVNHSEIRNAVEEVLVNYRYS